MIDRNLKNVLPERAFRTLEDMDRQIATLMKEVATLRVSQSQGQANTAQQLSDISGLIGARSQAVFGQDTTDPSLPGQIGGGTVTSIAASGGTTGFSFTGSPITSSGTITLTLTITAGAIPFGNAAGNGITTDPTKLFYDDTNDFFGMGTNAPNVPFHLVANFADWAQRIVNSNASGNGLVVSGGATTQLILQLRDKDGNVRVSFLADGRAGIGATPATSALLELSSTTGALLITRMTETQRDALTAVDGMLLYNSTAGKLQGREAGAWVNLI